LSGYYFVARQQKAWFFAGYTQRRCAPRGKSVVLPAAHTAALRAYWRCTRLTGALAVPALQKN